MANAHGHSRRLNATLFMSPNPIGRTTLHALLLSAVCLAAICPFFWYGSPSGHDFEFHMFSWMDVLSQWKQGVVYPRWAAMAHWGYGEARFLFYPPASWTLGAALGAFLPWKVVPGAYCWIVLMLSGLSMHRLARTWLPERDALFAAALYAVNPYHLVIVYWRSAFAELLGAALLPLLLLAMLRLRESGLRPVLGLGLVLAAAWLVNAPAAILIHYSAAGLAVINAILERSWKPIVRTAGAVTIGIGLASFYLIPTIYETRWVNISEVLAPGLRPRDNFLFTLISDPEHNQFNRLVSWIAAGEIAMLALTIWASRRERVQHKNRWVLISCWGGAAALIMISIAYPLWQILPKLRFVQLPWRWLLCLNLAMALLLTIAWKRWAARAVASVALLALVFIAGNRIQPPWWDQAADIREMSDAMADGTGYEGSDEYVPAGVDPYELKKEAPAVSSSHRNSRPARILQWGPTNKHIVEYADASELLTIRLLNYPAWEATVNGQPIDTQTNDATGQLVLPLNRGRNDIQISFARTRDRTIGAAGSLLSVLIVLGIWRKERIASPTAA
jgi:hypothetical protein